MTKQKLCRGVFSVMKKTALSDEELETVYFITAQNMAGIGLEVTNDSKAIFFDSMRKNFEDKNFVFFMFYKGESICGWSSVYKKQDNLYLSDIELIPQVKGTRLLASVLQYFVSAKEFENYSKFTFYINKKNRMSNKTFSHLGGEIIEEKQNGYLYLLTREKATNYLQKLRLT